MTKKKILFLCTGNYYRSRFAEEYFNHVSELTGLHWEASSRGLSQNMPSLNNPGPISVFTLQELKARNIPGKELNRYPRPIEKADFNRHDLIIALSEAEHKPMLEERYLAFSQMVQYFEVGDLPLESPENALPKIAELVDELIINLVKEEQNTIRLFSW